MTILLQICFFSIFIYRFIDSLLKKNYLCLYYKLYTYLPSTKQVAINKYILL